MEHDVHIYTDGAAKGNPGNGGYGVVMEWAGKVKKEFYEGFRRTTNNRMELLAVIVVLKIKTQY
jgi:ribonuclease HI